ncbi:MAG TPA: pyridoxamine 5'-phosphate oxidase family protein [Vicinamibacteria bacterium]|jgi:PPOX class probable F420-dependent enzyme
MAGLPDWAASFLAQRRIATLGTLDEDGSPHLTPVWFLFREQQFFVGCASSSRKARNAAARPTASLLVDTRTAGAERWVSGAGPVTILRGNEARPIVAAIQERYLTAEALRDPRIGPGFAAADDIALWIRPAQWRSWAAADLDAQFFGGVLTKEPKKWFRPLDPS